MEFNKAFLDCMRNLRRRLRDEQQLDIRLSQPDAIQAMLTACLRSTDAMTRELGRQLATFTDTHTPVTAKPVSIGDGGKREPSVRIYRGQRVLG